jgi:hypothetical protein
MHNKELNALYCLTTDWTTGRPEVRFPAQEKHFSSSLCVQTGSEAHTQPPIQWVPGILSPGVKRVSLTPI